MEEVADLIWNFAHSCCNFISMLYILLAQKAKEILILQCNVLDKKTSYWMMKGKITGRNLAGC